MVQLSLQSTDAMPEHQRWDGWKDTILAPVDAVPLAGAGAFAATRSVAIVGGTTLIDTTSQPLSFARSAADIARVGYDHACISIWMRGGLAIEPASGLTMELGPGDMTIYDIGRPYRVATRGLYRELRLLVPRQTFSSRVARLERLSSFMVPRTDGLGALATGYVASLFAALPTLSDDAAALGLDGAIHLLSNLFNAAPVTDGDLGATLPDPVVLALTERQIQARMGDPALDAGAIGRAIGVSRSRLYTALADRGGVATALREARLARAAGLLRAEAYRHRGIEDIARLCGFIDYSTFTRGFRRRFGVSPRAWRNDPGPL